jgi:putative flippase GtrA
MKKNWKTTIAGILTAIVAIGSAALAVLNGGSPDWAAVIAAISAGFGLLLAEDGKK